MSESLFQLCVNFICDHLQCLDSLVGFPDILGKTIFNAAFGIKPNSIEAGYRSSSSASFSSSVSIHVSRPDDYRNKLRVFFEAYGDCNILDSLSLQEDPLFLNNTIDDGWWLYQYVRQLDLAYCGLGDSHDILPQLLGSTYRLQTLILKGNALTDEGVRRLTLRNRMFIGNALPLETLDLSENLGITEKSLLFLNRLQKLTILNISNTSISEKAIFKQRLTASWRTLTDTYERETGCRCAKSRLTVVSSGWGLQAVQMWREQSVQVRKQRAEKRQCSRARLSIPSGERRNSPSFYKSIQNTEKTVVDKITEKNLSKSNDRIILVSRRLFVCPHSSVVDFDPCGPSLEKTSISILDSANYKDISDGSLETYPRVDVDFFYKDNRVGEKKLEKVLGTCSKNVAFDNSHEVPQTLTSCHNIKCTPKYEKPEHFKHTCDESNRLNYDINGLSDTAEKAKKEESVHSLVMEYQCSQSNASTVKRPIKRPFLEVLGEYM
ncbi:hypothetical protein EGW08_020765 [Elysia chlorotica]|uniref:Leucine-rich repeat-containing protein 42 n=1 Tax=Elysia chlorotica TaxID=188477 RepID=A0A433SQG1_ELYCH|nr:hypothetical protein EGW08_020765 [Elysia chlorotica]